MRIFKDIYEHQPPSMENYEINIRFQKDMVDKLTDVQVERLLKAEFEAAIITLFQYIMAQRSKDGK